MKKVMLGVLIVLQVMLLTGCWSKNELTDLGFVMGVAIDKGENGKVELLTQIYRPASTEVNKAATNTASSINVKTVDDTVMEAIRDIPIHVGRQAQWSHMRVIIVGEELAKDINIAKLLDFFYRDHEPRGNVKLMVSRGRAAKLFENLPLIEQTISQQFLRTQEFTSKLAAKTYDSNLISLMMQQKGATRNALVSYIFEEDASKSIVSSAGIALLKQGKLKVIIPSTKVEGLLMLRNEYQSGVIELLCEGSKRERESVEVLNMKADMKPILSEGSLTIQYNMILDIALAELRCTSIHNIDEQRIFIDKVSQKMKKQMEDSMTFLQKYKMDVLGVGEQIYRHSPQTWEKVQGDWDRLFSEASVQINLRMKFVTAGDSKSSPA